MSKLPKVAYTKFYVYILLEITVYLGENRPTVTQRFIILQNKNKIEGDFVSLHIS